MCLSYGACLSQTCDMLIGGMFHRTDTQDSSSIWGGTICLWEVRSMWQTHKISAPFEGALTCLWKVCSIIRTHKIPTLLEGTPTYLWEVHSIRRIHKYQLHLKGTHTFVRDPLHRTGTQDTNSTWEAFYSSLIHSSPWNIDFRHRLLTRLTLM